MTLWLKRMAIHGPGEDGAFKIADIVAAKIFQLTCHVAASVTDRAVENEWAIGRDNGKKFLDLGVRGLGQKVAGVWQVTGFVFFKLAYIKNCRWVFALHLCGKFGGGNVVNVIKFPS